MKNLLTKVFGVSVACVTALVLSTAGAQTPSAAADGTPAAPVAAASGSASAKAAATTAPASPKSLEAKTAMCFGCHNIKGYQSSFPEVFKVPKIAGQNAKYIAAALHAYKNGDRKFPTMRGIAETLTDQDIADIAAFYENLGKDERQAAPEKQKEPDSQVAGLVQKANCTACHGANFSKPIDPSYPKIAGQYPDYLYQALKAYKTEGNPAVGRNNGIMGAIAKQFSNAELKEIANYVGSLDGEVATIPEPRFHHR